MTFDEISDVVPWFELAHDQGQDLYAAQYGNKEGLPRVFKTHAWHGHCPKGMTHVLGDLCIPVLIVSLMRTILL